MKPTDWDNFLLAIAQDYGIRGKLKEVFLARFAYEHWRKSDLEVWEIAEAASHETYKKQMTQIYGVFSADRPQGCPELNATSRGPGKFQLLRDWFKEVKYPAWRGETGATLTLGMVTTGDSVYILRPPTEEQCLAELQTPGALLRIKGPEKTGKTALIQWLLAQVRGGEDRQVYLNLQTAEQSMLSSLDRFLRWFCANLGRELGLKPNLEDYWDEELFGSLVSCKTYVQDYILPQVEGTLILAIDNLDRLFDFPAIAQDFLPLLRFWHEESKNLPQWQKLRLIIANATEAYVKLDANQSPFNVGRQWKLGGFTPEELAHFRTVYGLPEDRLSPTEWEQWGTLVGGHPYLMRLALDHLRSTVDPAAPLLAQAVTQSGLYGDHLLRLWGLVTANPALMESLRRVVDSSSPVPLDPAIAYRLESLGLVTLKGDECEPSCPLYHRYFKEQLAREGA